LLNPQKGERIADLFCGLGNFSLPLAKSGALVVGIEGADYLVDRARENARLNRCAENMTFSVADLFDTDEKTVESWGQFDKMLLDPPRNGAYAVVK
ncbi:methyltransferase domain-containing protein, partial [Neisseria sp. P0001.S010]